MLASEVGAEPVDNTESNHIPMPAERDEADDWTRMASALDGSDYWLPPEDEPGPI